MTQRLTLRNTKDGSTKMVGQFFRHPDAHWRQKHEWAIIDRTKVGDTYYTNDGEEWIVVQTERLLDDAPNPNRP